MTRTLPLALVLALAGGCSEDDPAQTPAGDDIEDAATFGGTDAAPPDPDAPDTGGDDTDDTGTGTDDDTTGTGDPGGPTVGPTFAQAPVDPLANSGVESCSVYLEERCEAGGLRRCEIYDAPSSAWVDDPDPLLRRVLLYDRWHDLYSAPDGQTAERVYTGSMPGDATEGQWSDPAKFNRFAGAGDSAIWSGVALNAAIFRYVVSGTQADYERVEEGVRGLLLRFDVTGIPGHLARYHYLRVAQDGPHTDDHILRYEGSDVPSERDHAVGAAQLPLLPKAYTDGIQDAAGKVWPGQAMWNGHPSIDQYTGPMVAFPLVYGLLEDESLRTRIADHMTCYLKRLRRIEIVNLQSAPDVLEAMMQYFGGVGLELDPDDVDLTKTDSLVAFYHHGINSKNEAGFDKSCPDSLPLEPVQVIDAAAPDFILQMAGIVLALGEDPPAVDQIDHIYVPSLRGGDASHMIHLAAMAWYFTGDDAYRAFLEDELIANIGAPAVALTMQAFRPPPWCFAFYGDHITYSTHWQLITMLGDSELRDQMIAAMEEEMWQKAMNSHLDAKFDVMYASVVPEAEATGRQAAIERAALQLEDFGGNGGLKDAPRRTYDVDPAAVLAQLPAGTSLRCPTEAERQTCEQDLTVLGIPVGGETITSQCTSQAAECEMEDGLCAPGIASVGLPASLRAYADFMWQRSPFQIGDAHAAQGTKQSPGRDLSEPYWMARYYGFVTQGADQVLAWRDAGTCSQ